MEYTWSHGPVDVNTVHRVVGAARGITLHTIQSTMQRLFRKGLLDRWKVSHAYVYGPRETREAFQTRALERVMESLLRGERELMLSAFVDVAERAGSEELERLERLIAQRLQARRGRLP